MPLTEEQIQKLLEWFATDSETRRKWSEYRERAYEENHRWIQPNVIMEMSDKELESKFLDYYENGGGRQTLIQLNKKKIIQDINRFRETVIFLLDERQNIEDRINRVLQGEYRIPGFGKAIATSFLMDFDINKYCLWNNKTEMGFSVLGWELYGTNESPGRIYVKILEALKRLKQLKPEFNFTFEDIDLFLHTISAEEEGKKKVNEIVHGKIVQSLPKSNKETVKNLVIKMKVPWDKLSKIISGVIRPLKENGLSPEITLEIRGKSENGFDREIIENKIRETIQEIDASIEKWEEE